MLYWSVLRFVEQNKKETPLRTVPEDSMVSMVFEQLCATDQITFHPTTEINSWHETTPFLKMTGTEVFQNLLCPSLFGPSEASENSHGSYQPRGCSFLCVKMTRSRDQHFVKNRKDTHEEYCFQLIFNWKCMTKSYSWKTENIWTIILCQFYLYFIVY